MSTSFDFEQLTLGEVAFIEELSGKSISSIADDEAPKGNALAAIATVIKRRTGNPAFTFNEALALSLSEANALLGVGADEDPEEGKDDSSAENAPKSKRRSSSTSA